MTWEELTKKLETLGHFFHDECLCMPSNVKAKISKNGFAVLVSRLTFETGTGMQVGAELKLDCQGFVYLDPQREPRIKRGQEGKIPERIYFSNGPGRDYVSVSSSYEDFTTQAELMLSGQSPPLVTFNKGLAANTLEWGYYSLRRKIEAYFEQAHKVISEEQGKLWITARQKFFAEQGLSRIKKICLDSRKTVGNSKTLARIREEAGRALSQSLSPDVRYSAKLGKAVINIELPAE